MTQQGTKRRQPQGARQQPPPHSLAIRRRVGDQAHQAEAGVVQSDAVATESIDSAVISSSGTVAATMEDTNRLQAAPPPFGEPAERPVDERTCGICEEVFQSRNAMMRHVRERHPTGHGDSGGRGARERRMRKRTAEQVTPPLPPPAEKARPSTRLTLPGGDTRASSEAKAQADVLLCQQALTSSHDIERGQRPSATEDSDTI